MDAFIQDNPRVWRDVENGYLDGSLMAACGRSERALRLLRQSVSGGYCAHDAMLSDPLWASVRGTLEFRALLADAKACRDRFAAHVGRSSAP